MRGEATIAVPGDPLIHPDPERCDCGGAGWIAGIPKDTPCTYHVTTCYQCGKPTDSGSSYRRYARVYCSRFCRSGWHQAAPLAVRGFMARRRALQRPQHH